MNVDLFKLKYLQNTINWCKFDSQLASLML